MNLGTDLNTLSAGSCLPQNHISYEMEGKIKNMIKPLEKMGGIQYFCYGVNYADTSGFTLHTNSNYYENWFSHEGTLRGFYLKNGWHSYDHLLSESLLNKAHSENIGNFLTHIEHKNDKTFIFEFGTRPDDGKAMDFYLNHLPMLKRFCQYFVETMPKETLLRAEKERIYPHEYMLRNKKSHTDDAFLAALNQYNQPLNILTKPEKAYLGFILQGYSNNDIGEALNLSPKTVFKHIAKMKKKLACNKKSTLFTRACLEGVISYHFNIPLFDNQQILNVSDESILCFLAELYAPISKLSHQELRCFQLVLRGYTLQEISQKLDIQVPTVADYIWRMKNKLRCTSKIELFKKAIHFGLIEVSPEFEIAE